MNTEPRPVVLIDVDEVLFPYANAYDAWLLRNRGRRLDAELMQRYLIADAAGVEHLETAVAFINDPDTLHIAPVDGAAEAIVRLRSQFTLVACTSRRREPEGDATWRWLQANTPGFADLVCTSERHDDAPITKASVANTCSAVALVDDTAEHLALLSENCRGILLRRPEGLLSEPSAVNWAVAAATLEGMESLLNP